MKNTLSVIGTIQLSAYQAPQWNDLVGRSKRLNFSMEDQIEDLWCWAAVSKSIATYFDPSSTWTQCSIADEAWERTDCCGVGANGPCNQRWFLDSALSIVDSFARKGSSPESFSNIQQEITAGRPVCLRSENLSGEGHFLCITGWRTDEEGTNDYYVHDSSHGPGWILESRLKDRYIGFGKWTHTFFVRDPNEDVGALTTKLSGAQEMKA